MSEKINFPPGVKTDLTYLPMDVDGYGLERKAKQMDPTLAAVIKRLREAVGLNV